MSISQVMVSLGDVISTDIAWPTSTKKSAEAVPSSTEAGVGFPNSLPSDIPSLLLLVSVLEMLSPGTVSPMA